VKERSVLSKHSQQYRVTENQLNVSGNQITHSVASNPSDRAWE